jgi:hypothetical protein
MDSLLHLVGGDEKPGEVEVDGNPREAKQPDTCAAHT